MIKAMIVESEMRNITLSPPTLDNNSIDGSPFVFEVTLVEIQSITIVPFLMNIYYFIRDGILSRV